MVSAANLTGVGTLTGRTLSGKAYTVPTADFQSTVTAGGEQYVVSFKVTESPTGGNAVHSVDVVRVLKPEFNAQYDRNVTANGSEKIHNVEPNDSGNEESANNLYSAPNQDYTGFNFNRFLRNLVGNPPLDMIDPHAHHILFRTGLGSRQKALVAEGQELLRRYGIDPIFGKENLVWAPWRIKG